MKRVVLLAAFAILFFAFITQIDFVSATYCDNDGDCPPTYSGAYCWNGEIWDYQQNRYCDTELNSCDDDGSPVDHKVTVCANGCTAGSSTCNSAPTTTCECGGATPVGSTGTTTISCGSSYCDRGDFNTWSCVQGSWSGPGASCATCSDGYQNQGETGVDCGGPCSACSGGGTTTLPGPGESCADTQACQTGVTCDYDNICRTYNGLNGACGTNAKCLSPYVCTSSTGLGTCKVPVGGSCTSSNECYPVYHYTSDGQSSLYGDCTSSGVCSNTVYPTYSCTGPQASSSTLCSGDDSGLTANTPKSLVTSCTSGTKCEYTCDSGYYPYAGSCHAKKADNDYCTYGYECTGGQCNGGYCSTPITTVACPSPPTGNGVRLIQSLKPEGSTIAWTYIEPTFVGPTGWCTWTCNTGYYPADGTCNAKKADNAFCSSGIECTSGYCSFTGYCYTPTTMVACDSPQPSGTNVKIISSTHADGSSGAWQYISPTATGPFAGCQWTCEGGFVQAGTACAPSGGGICGGTKPSGDGVDTGDNYYYSGATYTSWSYVANPFGIKAGCTWDCLSGYTRSGNTCIAGGTTTPTSSLTAAPATQCGGYVTLTWSASGMSSCTNDWTNTWGTGGQFSGSMNYQWGTGNAGSKTYTYTCTTPSGNTIVKTATSDTSGVCTSCTPETNTAFCNRLGKNCGSVTANDNCVVSRTVNCGTCTGSQTCNSQNICETPQGYSCTGTIPNNAQLCNNDDQGLNEDTERILAQSCTVFRKCQYTCTSPYVYSGSGAAASCVLPSTITTVGWKNLQGATLTQADLNDRVVMSAVGTGFTGKKVVFTLYKSVTGFDDKLESFTATPTSDTIAAYNVTLTTTGNIYFKANITAGDYVDSAEIPVSSIPNNAQPVVVINSPAAGGIYFVGSSIQFSHSSYDVDSNITSILWNFGDGTTSSSNAIGHTYTTLGQKTISLRVTDEHGASVTQTRQIMIANATPGTTSYSLLTSISAPSDQQAIISPNLVVNYDSSDTYLISTTVSSTTPCTVSVACVQGRCPGSTTASPSCAANPNTPIDITGEPQGHSQLFFNWTFRDGNTMLTPDAALGKVTGTKGFASTGIKNITLQVKYTQNSQNIQSTGYRGFQLFNQRQCSNDGATWYDINGAGIITGSYSTLNTVRCAGADNRVSPDSNDDCCPLAMACSTSTSAPGCRGDSNPTGCSSYTAQVDCNADSSQRVRTDILWNYPPYHCGQTADGRNYFCSCVWDNNACRFNASSRSDGLTGGTTSCSYSTTAEQCVDGYQQIRIIAIPSGSAANPDPQCVNSTQTLPCGRPVVALPFAGIPQIIAALGLIAIVYFILHGQKKKKKRV